MKRMGPKTEPWETPPDEGNMKRKRAGSNSERPVGV